MAVDADSPAVVTDLDEQAPLVEVAEDQFDGGGRDSDGLDDTDGTGVSTPMQAGRLRAALSVGALILIALTGLTAYLGVRAHQAHQVAQEREQFLQVARQGALNLTTIDWEHADADIQRILASSSGSFYDDFSQRSKPFMEVLQKTQSKSVGTVTEAGLESFSGDEAQALVAVSVTTTNPSAPDQTPRNWRMRVTVHKDGDEMKVSNVEFVP